MQVLMGWLFLVVWLGFGLVAQANASSQVVLFSAGDVVEEAHGTVLSQTQQNCTPVDIVVAIDQSSSMQFTDPNNLRLDAVRNLIERLYLNAALQCSGTSYYFGVVGFGSDVEVMIPMTEILVHDIKQDNWQGAMRQLSANLLPKDLDQTDHARALIGSPQSAYALLQAAPEREGRKQVIMLVTDGMPCTPAALARQSNLCGSRQWVEHAFYANQSTLFEGEDWGFPTEKGLIRTFEEKLPPPPHGPLLYVLLFSEQAAPWDFVDRAWGQIASSHGGEYVPPSQIDTQDKITATLDGILSQVLENKYEAIECNKPFYLEPYLSATTIITSIRPSQDVRVELVTPSGQVYSDAGTNFEYSEGESYERFIVRNPEPGAWRIQVSGGSCDQIEAFYETVEATASFFGELPDDVVVNLDPPYYVDDETKKVEIIVRNKFGDPFVEDPEYPLQVCGTVNLVEGYNPTVERKLRELGCIPFDFIGDGIWRSRTPLPAPAQGKYRLTVEAWVESVNPENPQRLSLFRLPDEEEDSDAGVYSTAAPVPVSLQLESPVAGARLPLNTYDGEEFRVIPISVRVRIVDEMGVAQPSQQLFREQGLVNQAVEAVLRDAQGAVLDTVLLSPSEEDNTLFVGELQTQAANLVTEEGDYVVQVRLTDEGAIRYNRENYQFRVDVEPRATIQRYRRFGVVVRIVSPRDGQELLLNEINSEFQAVGIPVVVHVQLVRPEDDAPLLLQDIFGTNAEAVTASLRGPSGEELQSPIYLHPSAEQPTILQGTLRDDETLDPEGEYTLEVRLVKRTGYDAERYVFLQPEATRSFTRVRLHGVVPQIVTPRDGSVLDLNVVEGDSQRGEPVRVCVGFVDPTMENKQHADPSVFLNVEAPEVVSVTMKDADGTPLETKLLDYTPGEGFCGNLRDDPDVIDSPGSYTIVASLNPNAFLENPRYKLLRQETARVTVVRKERVDLKLRAIGPTDMLLNTIEDGLALNQPVPAAVELVNQSGEPLQVTSVFSPDQFPDLGQLVQAKLYYLPECGESSELIESVWLRPEREDSPRFVGTLREKNTELDQPGCYTVKYSFREGLSRPELSSNVYYGFAPDATATKPFRRIRRYGVSVELVKPNPARTTWMWLNDVDRAQRRYLPVPIQIEAQLVNLEGDVWEDPTRFAQVDLDHALVAVIEGPNNLHREIPLSWDASRHIFGAEVKRVSQDAETSIDPSGEYTVRVEVRPELIDTTPLSAYESVSSQASVTFTRKKKFGVYLEVVSIGGHKLPTREGSAEEGGEHEEEAAEYVVDVPLYLSICDAFGEFHMHWQFPPVYFEPVEAPVPIEFVLRDLNGESVPLKRIVSTDDFTVDQVIEVVFSVDGRRISLGPGDFVQRREEDNYIIEARIANQAVASGVYTVRYRLLPDLLKPDGSVKNFSERASEVQFKRGGTDDLLHEPALWRRLRLIGIVLLVAYLVNACRVNWVFSGARKGQMRVKYNVGRAGASAELVVPLGRVRPFALRSWRKKKRAFPVLVGREPGKIILEAAVRPAKTKKVSTGAPSPLPGRRSPAATSTSRGGIIYEVRVKVQQGEKFEEPYTFEVPFGGEVRVLSFFAKHEGVAVSPTAKVS